MRATFEKYGTPLPEGEGEYLCLRPGMSTPLLVHISDWGQDGLRWGGRLITDPSASGLYLPLARLFAAVEVADELDRWVEFSGESMPIVVDRALTTYRNTR